LRQRRSLIDVLGTEQTNAGLVDSAFSYWGGDFWFYYSSNRAPSQVIRYKAATDKTQDVVLNDVGGFKITGAGVSTCAPTVPVVK
jgi:hypothetical protein